MNDVWLVLGLLSLLLAREKHTGTHQAYAAPLQAMQLPIIAIQTDLPGASVADGGFKHACTSNTSGCRCICTIEDQLVVGVLVNACRACTTATSQRSVFIQS